MALAFILAIDARKTDQKQRFVSLPVISTPAQLLSDLLPSPLPIAADYDDDITPADQSRLLKLREMWAKAFPVDQVTNRGIVAPFCGPGSPLNVNDSVVLEGRKEQCR
jgi:hypothetical protein